MLLLRKRYLGEKTWVASVNSNCCVKYTVINCSRSCFNLNVERKASEKGSFGAPIKKWCLKSLDLSNSNLHNWDVWGKLGQQTSPQTWRQSPHPGTLLLCQGRRQSPVAEWCWGVPTGCLWQSTHALNTTLTCQGQLKKSQWKVDVQVLQLTPNFHRRIKAGMALLLRQHQMQNATGERCLGVLSYCKGS